MGTKELRTRKNWQTVSQIKATDTEHTFYSIFEEYCATHTDYEFIKHPQDFNNIYKNVILPKKVLESIYTPTKDYRKHGINPDFAIRNKRTNKILFGEIKRQDGWVENKRPKDGRGNAHERLCKYFTPGLMEILRNKGICDTSILPFWVVFKGDITRDPKRVREIHLWFGKYKDNFILWQDETNSNIIINHFETKLKQYLD
ncbi:MAG: MunI family type II restriction endonuclease [Christensenellaceae bacterium]|jgi:hypothetical protein|nr:MunI family type II restriction endonuclease [Christensenellaceae bacterium]